MKILNHEKISQSLSFQPIVFISCSKEADLYNSDLNQQKQGTTQCFPTLFKVGELDGSGIANHHLQPKTN